MSNGEREVLVAFFLDDKVWQQARGVQNRESNDCYAEGRPYNHRPHAEFMADALLAAGYRNRPMPSVEDMAKVLFNAEKGHGLALDATFDSALYVDQELRRRMARAVLALFNPKEES